MNSNFEYWWIKGLQVGYVVRSEKLPRVPRVWGLWVPYVEAEAELEIVAIRKQLRGFKGQLMHEERAQDWPDDWDGEGNP